MLPRSREAFAEAQRYLPGGVSSAARAFGPVGGDPPVLAAGEGAHVRDIDGNEYVDLVMSWGPLIRGHAHRDVVRAIAETAAKGTSFGATTEHETKLARVVCNRVPSVELVRFTNSGTEATMSAIRLARGVTGRDKIVKFAGCWHGHADPFLIAAGSSALSLGRPDSPGVPADVAKLTLVAPYNDAAAAGELLKAHEVAAVIVEPVAGNMGCVPPVPGFLEGLRDSCSRFGACLILDEVITGFRVARGGAQELFRVMPDLTTMGKTIGGGLPVGAFGGKRRFMEHVAPLGMRVSQGGTLSGNPLAMEAGLATIGPLDEKAYEALEEKGRYLGEGLRHPSVTVQRVGSMMTVFFTTTPVRNLADAEACDTKRFARWHRAMLKRGVYLPPSQFEAFFVSLAHERADLDKVIAAHREALKEIG
ncbi:MAG TPA: glutamate-1-semialdehyde 2,1-aminomutase [Planctomycetota bacterium]|nr:glutamate-1-semialdehyde 2,1-aminomutase [Planctomycetota bacterium]